MDSLNCATKMAPLIRGSSRKESKMAMESKIVAEEKSSSHIVRGFGFMVKHKSIASIW